ncbi:putative transcriptional regulator, AsnC family [Rippkaea orientalis PCC 8801]|uniref:Putative transcriptional regulator, AsnC family n=1 Tax=Rippkaea orientalis (strain PCC 8801 / RF-1) TaxID=41431 RepID=B7K383_RIPO1|nr:AsnC family transcriptional regulator [Rippkaea orientalis]ACK64403.1 putative transcriptional regulator, AsnC family [Rippkaea orientalis PCC 8801]
MTKFYENQESESSGLSFSDLQQLGEEEKSLINWLRRSGKKSLPEIAEKLSKDENSALALITPLVDQGFIKEVPGNPDGYQVKQPQRRKQTAIGLIGKKKSKPPEDSATDDAAEDQ